MLKADDVTLLGLLRLKSNDFLCLLLFFALVLPELSLRLCVEYIYLRVSILGDHEVILRDELNTLALR